MALTMQNFRKCKFTCTKKQVTTGKFAFKFAFKFAGTEVGDGPPMGLARDKNKL